jgi:hypothetical protein
VSPSLRLDQRHSEPEHLVVGRPSPGPCVRRRIDELYGPMWRTTPACPLSASLGAMGFAVNACTMGMAVVGLMVGSLNPHIDRRMGILASLLLLAKPLFASLEIGFNAQFGKRESSVLYTGRTVGQAPLATDFSGSE